MFGIFSRKRKDFHQIKNLKHLVLQDVDVKKIIDLLNEDGVIILSDEIFVDSLRTSKLQSLTNKNLTFIVRDLNFDMSVKPTSFLQSVSAGDITLTYENINRESWDLLQSKVLSILSNHHKFRNKQLREEFLYNLAKKEYNPDE